MKFVVGFSLKEDVSKFVTVCYSEHLNRAEISVFLEEKNGGEKHMDGKMVVAIGLILSLVLPISLFAIPALADVNGTDNGDQIQDPERLRVQDNNCNSDMIQEQERLRLHEQDCNGECVCSQHRERQRVENRICNNKGNLE